MLIEFGFSSFNLVCLIYECLSIRQQFKQKTIATKSIGHIVHLCAYFKIDRRKIVQQKNAQAGGKNRA